MGNFFTSDSIFARFMSRVFDLIILNVLCVLTSIPVITIGASATALYTVCFQMRDNRNSGIIAPYFLAFKENFLKATALWLFILAFGSAFVYNIFLCLAQDDAIHYLTAVFVILLTLMLFLFVYTFPLQSRFENKIRYTLINALYLSLRHLPRSLLMTSMLILPVVLIFVDLNLFVDIGVFWFVLYFAAIAYLSTSLLNKTFDSLKTKNKDGQFPHRQ